MVIVFLTVAQADTLNPVRRGIVFLAMKRIHTKSLLNQIAPVPAITVNLFPVLQLVYLIQLRLLLQTNGDIVL